MSGSRSNIDIEADLARIAHQERELWFPSFGEQDAWRLGLSLQAVAADQQLPVVIDIQRLDRQLFYAAMPGATFDNEDWVRRKRNVVRRFVRSSYALGLEMRLLSTTLADYYGLPAHKYAAGGGGFPIQVNGTGLVGTVTVSGLPERQDHHMVAAALWTLLGRTMPMPALD